MSNDLLDFHRDIDGRVYTTCPVCNSEVELLPVDTSREVEELYEQPCDSCGSKLSLNVLRLPNVGRSEKHTLLD